MSIIVINPKEFAELCKGGRKIDLIDVRTPVEFREVHVETARNVPLDQLDAAVVMQARNGSANEPLYVICRSGSRPLKQRRDRLGESRMARSRSRETSGVHDSRPEFSRIQLQTRPRLCF